MYSIQFLFVDFMGFFIYVSALMSYVGIDLSTFEDYKN